MVSELIVAGAVLLVLVFLSTIESAYESLSEVSLRVIAEEREASPRTRFFRELLEHSRETHHTPGGAVQQFVYCYCRRSAS